MAFKLLSLAGVAQLSLISGVDAFFRMECRGRSGIARIDPLYSAGLASQHVHAIHGSRGFSESATYDDLLNANCTSCAAEQDKSAYWTPALYFQHSSGEVEIVPQVGGMLAYYLFRDPLNNVKAFPKDFRMVAGSTNRRSWSIANTDPSQPDPEQSSWAALNQTSQSDLAQRALGFNCLNYAITPEAALFRHFLPDKTYLDANCKDGIRLELAFPSCWNGKDVDSTDHKSHMAYPDLVQDGNCPEGFSVRLVTLFYETIWNTYAFKDQAGQFVISNGDPTGYGYHGDFMTGWNPDFLQQVVETCTDASGEVTACSLLTIQSQDTQGQCKIDLPAALATENVLGGTAGTLTTLPGNVQIQYGPGSATEGGNGASTTAAVTTTAYSAPTLTYSPGHSSSYPGGGIFAETSESGLTINAVSTTEIAPAATSTPVTTPAPTLSPDPSATYMTVSTQYITNGAQVQEVIWEEQVVYVTEDVVTTTTVTAGGVSKSSHKKGRRSNWWRRHGHHGHNL